MILVQTAGSEWPPGGWPGIFALANNSVKHVAHLTDVAAYQKVGVKGPITISKADFLQYPDVTVTPTATP